MSTYREQTWHYLVRQWKQDGPSLFLQVLANGQTDNINHAFHLCNRQREPTHVYDVHANKIIHRNY